LLLYFVLSLPNKKGAAEAAPLPISKFQFPLQFTIFLNESNASRASAYLGSIDSDC
jgi:hypothetical protein